jgi:hypothetical protein
VTAEPNTSSPMLTPATSAPTSSTIPAASSPGMLGSGVRIVDIDKVQDLGRPQAVEAHRFHGGLSTAAEVALVRGGGEP